MGEKGRKPKIEGAGPQAKSGSASRVWPANDFSQGRVSRMQIFRNVPASKFAHPPDRSYRCEYPPQGSRGFYIRAHRALLPPHAADMLTVRIQAIDGTGTFTLPDFQPCRLLTLLRGRYSASQLIRTHPPPSRRQSISRLSRLYDLPCSEDRALFNARPITSRAAWPARLELPKRDPRATGAADSALSSRP